MGNGTVRSHLRRSLPAELLSTHNWPVKKYLHLPLNPTAGHDLWSALTLYLELAENRDRYFMSTQTDSCTLFHITALQSAHHVVFHRTGLVRLSLQDYNITYL
jgi:hypothetical protein